MRRPSERPTRGLAGKNGAGVASEWPTGGRTPVSERARAAAIGKWRRNDVRTAVRRRKAVDTPGVSQDNSRLLSAEGYPSGQRGQTVNLLAMPSKVRILPPPPIEWRGQVGKAGVVQR